MSGQWFAEEQERAQAQVFGQQAEEMNIDTVELSQLQTQSAAAAAAATSLRCRKRTAAAAFAEPDEAYPPAKRRCGPRGKLVPVPAAATTTNPPAPPADDDDDYMDWEGFGFRLGSPVSDGDSDLAMGYDEDDEDDGDSVAMSTFASSEAPSPERYF